MNKDLLNQLQAEQQPAASKLYSAAEQMKVPQNFQWKLESQLMEAYQKPKPAKGSYTKIISVIGWAIVAVSAIFFLNWIVSSLRLEQPPVPGSTPNIEKTFAEEVKAGNICGGPLAIEHNYAVSLSNQDKTGFITLDEEKNIGELRSFAWSLDGEHLAIIGNTTGSGNIYLTDLSNAQLTPVLSNSELPYLMEVSWSRDGKQLLTWSVQDNTVVYLMNLHGTGLREIKLGMYISSIPQFAPDNKNILFYGADFSQAGLFEAEFK